jgi:hypothetical protein
LLAKLINGALSYAPKKIIVDGKTIFNPPEDILKAQGYKELQTAEMPDDAPENKLYVSSWTDAGETIQQVWTLVDAPPKSREELAVELATKQINTMDLSDSEALYFTNLYPEWTELCQQSYAAEKEGFKFQHLGKLYKTRQENFTFQSQWIPGEGTSAIYTQIVEEQAGTLEDPIDVPADVTTNAFTYIIGKYYRWNGVIYKCERSGDEEGKEYSFVYSPDQMIGNYFTQV